MSRITTGTGLMSGLDIDDIVTKLMDISKRPLQALQTRVDNTTAKKTSFVELTALLLKVKMDTQAMFDTGNIFSYRSVSSSNESVLTATAGKSAPLGNYSFTVKSLVQAHQMMSGGYSGADSTIGAGTISIESGNGNVDRTTSLEDLNAGAGVAGGSIEITDRSGRSALVDLSGATTVADVLGAINGTTGLGVRASVSGDHLVLTDTTGATASNIIVEEVSGGSTAADIGLLGNSASATLAGNDIVALGRSTLLDSLNDGRGVRSIGGVTDFTITRKDGTSLDVQVSGNETVGDLLDSINNNAANADGRLVASLSGDGKGITLTDSTGGVGNLTVAAQNGSLAAADLGLIGDTPGAAVTGRRLIAGLNTVLLGSLNGGAGVAAGSILITNRAGASATVDLSAAGTLTDVIAAINASGVNVTASYNSSRTGLMLTDSSAGLGAFSVAEAGSTTAADLKIAGSAMGNTIRGANLQMQYINERTTLASLNNGDGVYKGSFRITDRAGGSALVDLSQDTDTRIEDVLAEINSRGIGVRASINATGDGILLTDTSGGLGDLKVENVDGMTATDLRIAGTASSTDPTHIDGSYEMHVTILATDTLQTIATKMSGSGAPITAKVISDGSRVSPYHISLISEQAGTSGNMVIDTGGLNLDFRTTQEGRDAVVLYGQQMSGSQGMLIRSSTNTISGIIDGVTLSLKGVSDSPVSIAVTSDDDSIVSEVSSFVDDWNATIGKIQSLTAFDPDTQKAGALLGDPDLMRIEDQLNAMIGYNAPGMAARFNRLSRIGVSFMETGKLSFDESKLRIALGTDRNAVEKLFTTKGTGLGSKFTDIIDKMTDDVDGLIARKADTYDKQIEVFQSQIDSLSDRLAKEQERLYNQFYAMEEALANLQTQKTAVDNIPSANIWNSDNKKS